MCPTSSFPFPTPPAAEADVLTDEERGDLNDAIDQDKELRWLERDASIAERSLVTAPEGIGGAELRRLHQSHLEAQARLAAAHEAIMNWLRPQFHRRRAARAADADAVVITREEFRMLSVEERDRLEQGGRDATRLAQELKAKARDILSAKGWTPRAARQPTVGGRAPHLPASAWGLRHRLESIFAAALR
jgi:hypothetical protein